MSKIINLPPVGNMFTGRYTAKVVEPLALPRLRRRAYKQAGLTGHYDGSMADYHRLSQAEKDAHDSILSGLVRDRQDKLNSEAARRVAKEVFTTGEHNNLALDQGLNKMLQASGTINWGTWGTYNVRGEGTTPTFTDSGAITATTSGSSTTVTASSSIFTASHVGQLIKFDSGEERYIASQTGTACVVTVAVDIASPTLFCIWAVNQTAMASETGRTNTYLTGAGNCGSSWASNVWSGKRTYDHPAEVSNKNYTELGWSDLAAAGANLNARTLISGGTVSVLIGQQLRVVYTVNVTVTPAVSTPGNTAITGWPVAPAATQDGDYIVANPSTNIGPNITTNGITSATGDFPMTRATAPGHNLCTGSTLPAFGNSYSAGTIATSGTNAYASYTAGSFFLDISGTFSLTTGNATNWRGVNVSQASGYVFVWDEAQTKDSSHTLTITSRMSVGRTLVNP